MLLNQSLLKISVHYSWTRKNLLSPSYKFTFSYIHEIKEIHVTMKLEELLFCNWVDQNEFGNKFWFLLPSEPLLRDEIHQHVVL